MLLRLALACFLASFALALPPAQIAAPQQRAASLCFVPPAGAPLWSDPAAWPGGSVPGAGDCATIPVGTTLYLDTSTEALSGLSIQGELIVLCGDHTITSDWIQVKGLLQIGTYAHRFHQAAKIALTDDWNCPSPIVAHMPPPATVLAPPVLAVEGAGVLRLIGADVGAPWTRLASTAPKDQAGLLLSQAPGWRAGQQIVIASTDFDMSQAEERVIGSIAGAALTLTADLDHTHWGETEGQSFDGSGIEERAEVALLDRHIVVEGVQGDGFSAGHTLFMNPEAGMAPRGELESVEFRYLGNRGELGQYPVHFHHVGDATGSFVRNSSVHASYNRAITLHMSQNVEVTGNVSYDCLGHAFYFEGDSVTGCTMRGNLGFSTKVGQTLPSDQRPATFWLHNPLNVIEDNAAAGSAGDGFWFQTEHFDPNPWTSFSGNVAHSNAESGFMQDEQRPAPQPASIYENLTSYKNRRFGFWLRTYGESIIEDSQFADNRCGVYFASEGFQFELHQYLSGGSASATGISKAWLLDSLVIGETANVGEPQSCEELLAGRSLPQVSRVGDPLLPAWTALTGVEIYDGFVAIEDCTFAEFRDKSMTFGGCSLQRKAGALHQVFHYNPWSVDPRNHVRGLTFVDDGSTVTRPVYYRTPQGMQPPPWCTSAYQIDDGGLANLVLLDEDGSLGTLPGSSVYPPNPFLDPTSGVSFDADWNAMVTSGPPSAPYAQLDFAQLHGISATATTTWDGKPILAAAGLHAVVRDEWFVKAAPVLDICSPTSERPIPRIVSNVLTDDFYEYHYDPALTASDWPEQVSISLQFTEPGRWVYATIPLAAAPAPEKVVVNGAQATLAADAGALHLGPGNEWWYDAAAQRIHLKLVTGGSGSSVDDGLRSTFVVNF